MGYPDYPNNRLLVKKNKTDEFTDLTEQFKMVLTDGHTLEPPAPKTYVVDIPGGNGKLDLTDSLLGDTAYDTRNQEFIFYIIEADEFEKIKTQISNFLHGKEFYYAMTMDSYADGEYYIYHGRFSVDSYSHSPFDHGLVGAIKISITADPYKFKEVQHINVDASGGITAVIDSGRKKVRPRFRCDRQFKVIYKNEAGVNTLIRFPIHSDPNGMWTINDLMFENGPNEIYINSYDVQGMQWISLKSGGFDEEHFAVGVTWGEFKTRKLYEWYKSESTLMARYAWEELNPGQQWSWTDTSVTGWSELMYPISLGSISANVLIEYEWGDL